MFYKLSVGKKLFLVETSINIAHILWFIKYINQFSLSFSLKKTSMHLNPLYVFFIKSRSELYSWLHEWYLPSISFLIRRKNATEQMARITLSSRNPCWYKMMHYLLISFQTKYPESKLIILSNNALIKRAVIELGSCWKKEGFCFSFSVVELAQ